MKSVAWAAMVAFGGLALAGSSCADSSASELGGGGATAAFDTPAQARSDTGSIRPLIDGIRGANAIQCELLLQAFSGWTSNVPDMNAEAWTLTQRLRRRVSDASEIAWLGEQVRGADRCAARAAARLLGRSPSAAARTLLVGALGDANPQVRQLAAIGIGWRSDSTVNARLISLLADRNAEVRAAAAWALGAVH
jgi:hypothetical protein